MTHQESGKRTSAPAVAFKGAHGRCGSAAGMGVFAYSVSRR
ncbi:MAG: hypothetical protein R6W95_04665 [Desulfosarcina sp.]